MHTARLEVRAMVETDRARFVELFTDPDFMVFFGVQSEAEAHRRVDHLLELNATVPFAKQPIVVRETGTIVGYAGVDRFDLDGRPELEFGYRLVPAARGLGYATEAGLALLGVARETSTATVYGIVHADNAASIRTIEKLGFTFWKQDLVDGERRNLYRWRAQSSSANAPSSFSS